MANDDYSWSLKGYTQAQLYDHLKSVVEKAYQRFQPEIKEFHKRYKVGSNEDYKFQEADGRVNVLGVRGFIKDSMQPCVSTNFVWDDTLFVIYKQGGKKRVDSYYLNTEQNMVDKKTSPIGGKSYLLLGMHRYKLGKHRGKDRALRPDPRVKTIHDKNQNYKDDEGTGPQWLKTINIHYGGNYATPKGMSLGCQTIKNRNSYNAFLKRVESDHSIKGVINNEFASKPARDGRRSVIYTLVEGTFLKPEGAKKWTFPIDPVGISAINTHYRNNERGNSGFYPIGWYRLWHSGIHLWGRKNIKACADGKIVAARLFPNDPDPVDGGRTSRCFVLIQHTLKLQGRDGKKIMPKVWSLYYHLAHIAGFGRGSTGSRWLDSLTTGYDPKVGNARYLRILTTEDQGGLNFRKTPNGAKIKLSDGTTRIRKGELATYNGGDVLPSWAPVSYAGHKGYVYTPNGRVELVDGTASDKVNRLLAGEVVALNIPVVNGEVIGQTGQEKGKYSLHFEIFTEEVLNIRPFFNSPFEQFEDYGNDAVADVTKLMERLDTEGSGWKGYFTTDGKVTDKEAKAAAQNTRHLIVKHTSEWAVTNWGRLRQAPWKLDTVSYTNTTRELKKLQFWSELGAGGPSGSRIVSYHPLTFIKTIQAEIDRQSRQEI